MKTKIILAGLLVLACWVMAPPPSFAVINQPARIGGTLTANGVQITQDADDGFVIVVTDASGTPFQDFTGNPSRDADGLNTFNYYIIDIPIFDATDQPLGAKPGSGAVIHVIRNNQELTVASPAGGSFIIPDVGTATTINLDANDLAVPGAPMEVTATAGNAQATVSFTPPVSDGGSPITSYAVTSNPDGKTATGAASPITVTGLTNGTAYSFTVTATNAVGTGPASATSNSVTPATVPGAPTGVTATAGNAQATVTFIPPASDGGSPITGYRVTSSPGGKIGTGTSSPITVTGLTNGTAYTFKVRAVNAMGTGSASIASNSVTPKAPGKLPGAPTGVTATAGNARATVSFAPPASDGGSPITGYRVTSSPGGKVGTGTSSPITVTGLTNGTAYTFKVRAINAMGTGPASTASNSVKPATVPGAPTGVTAAAGNARATVSFAPPASDGGSPVTGYRVTSSPGGKVGTGTSSPITVTGLTNGTAYTFKVRAINAMGTGPASAASNSVTPGGDYGWRTEAKMPSGADWAGSAVAEGKLYVIGGGEPETWDKLRIFNPSTKKWTQKSVGEMGYLLRAATVSDSIFIFDTSYLGDSIWMYDLTSKTLSSMGGNPANMGWTSEPAVYNGKVYFFGGYGPLKTTWEFDPSTLVITQKADMPTAGYGSSTAVLNGKIYVIGGNYRNKKIEIYNPKTNTWELSLSFSALNLFGWDTAAPLAGKIAIVDSGSGKTFLYDPVTKKLTAQQAMPRLHGDCLVGEALGGRLYVAGGEDGPMLLDSFGLIPEQGSITDWSPMSEEEMLEASEPDCRSVEESHLQRAEELEQRAASLK